MEILLTSEQLAAAEEVMINLSRNKKALLSGISGTGKSTTVKHIIQKYIDAKKQVQLTATTHKALEVVSLMSPAGVTSSTIHSFLNLIPDRSKYNSGMIKNPKGRDKYAHLLIVDEYSMITEDVIGHLNDWLYDNPESSVLFVGDSSQLILADKDIDKLELEKVTSYLTTPMRQGKLSDIAMYSKMVSEFILGKGPEPSIPWGEEILQYESHKDFITAWKKCRADDKAILAFKNVTVNHYNKNIAKHYRHQASEYEVGNRVVLRSSVITKDGNMIPNRRTVTIEAIEDMETPDGKSKYYEVDSDFGSFKINKTAQWLNALTQKFAQEMNWHKYYEIREKYVQVHHADALTVHGSQGSSFEEVFIDATDIMSSHSNVRRMAYVAISRASSKAHIFMGNERDYSKFRPEMDDVEF